MHTIERSMVRMVFHLDQSLEKVQSGAPVRFDKCVAQLGERLVRNAFLRLKRNEIFAKPFGLFAASCHWRPLIATKGHLHRHKNRYRSRSRFFELTAYVNLHRMVTTAKKKAGRWGVYDYEVMMYWGTSRPVRIAVTPGILIVKNALTESRVLHARNLCDILLSRKNSSDNDDVRLKDLLPGFRSNHTKQLNKAYHGTDDEANEERPPWIFNKMLAHPTTQRYEGWNYESALNRIAPHITKLLDEIAAARTPTTSNAVAAIPAVPRPTE